jgi:hypothetical protein
MPHDPRPQNAIPALLDRLAAEQPLAYAQLVALPFGPIPAFVADEGDTCPWWTKLNPRHEPRTRSQARAPFRHDGSSQGRHQARTRERQTFPPPLLVARAANQRNTMPRKHARFLISYRIAAKTYSITLPGQSAAAVRQGWKRPGSTLLDVVECDHHGLPV